MVKSAQQPRYQPSTTSWRVLVLFVAAIHFDSNTCIKD